VSADKCGFALYEYLRQNHKFATKSRETLEPFVYYSHGR
jgi:hypothetical protein